MGVPWRRVERTVTVGAQAFSLDMLEDFEAATVDVYRHLRGRRTTRDPADLCPMFGVLWPGARCVAAHLDALGPALRGEPLLELGCGLALPSLVAARHGARPVATDFHPDAGPFLARNTRRNGLDVPYVPLDWRRPADSGLPPRAYPRVIATDVLFASELPGLVAAMFDRFLTDDGEGWLTDPGRAWLDEFVDAAEARGLGVTWTVEQVAGDEVFRLVLRRRDRP